MAIANFPKGIKVVLGDAWNGQPVLNPLTPNQILVLNKHDSLDLWTEYGTLDASILNNRVWFSPSASGGTKHADFKAAIQAGFTTAFADQISFTQGLAGTYSFGQVFSNNPVGNVSNWLTNDWLQGTNINYGSDEFFKSMAVADLGVLYLSGPNGSALETGTLPPYNFGERAKDSSEPMAVWTLFDGDDGLPRSAVKITSVSISGGGGFGHDYTDRAIYNYAGALVIWLNTENTGVYSGTVTVNWEDLDGNSDSISWDVAGKVVDEYDAAPPVPTSCSDGQCGCEKRQKKENTATGAIAVPTTNSSNGNSVLLSSGRFSFSQPLMSIGSLGGVGWSLSLDYLSGNNVDGVLGKGFNFPQNMYFAAGESTDVILYSGDNTQQIFEEDSVDGTTIYYKLAANNHTQSLLVRTNFGGSNDRFTLTGPDGTVTVLYGLDGSLDAPGRLVSIADRFGNLQTYTWTIDDTQVQLASVTDAYGRTVTYSYYDEMDNKRLREVEDFLGRKLNFQYDDLGHLVAVITPSIEQAAEGNTFPNGTAYVFQYDVENADPDRQDDLIKIWFPNETAPLMSATSRSIDVDEVYSEATPRYEVTYGQNLLDPMTYGRVTQETVGNPTNDVGGSYQFAYTTTGVIYNIVDPDDPIVFQATVTDRNGNMVTYGFNSSNMPVLKLEDRAFTPKCSVPSEGTFPNYRTWTKYNELNQPVLVIYPEGNSVEYEYEDGTVTGITGTYEARRGLLRSETRKVDNPYATSNANFPSDPTNPMYLIPAHNNGASSGQTQLTKRYFFDPIFNQQCAIIEERGNPINGDGDYFTPQNEGDTPTDADRSRYATIQYFDYQQNTDATIKGDSTLQALLFPEDDASTAAANIQSLLDYVDDQMKADDGSGGIPTGFVRDLGDINGDGTGDGDTSGLPAARMVGSVVKVKHPSVRLIGSASITTQVREELFTVNDRGQTTTHTDPEGNLTVYVRYPGNDPEGDGQFISTGLSGKQYGRMREVHVDADPNDVLSLVGADGDLVDFIPGIITRTNTPDIYQDLVTRYEGSRIGAGGGCAAVAYDQLGNPLAVTDPRGFTTHFDRNELGEVYRTTSPDPYRYRVETYFDANRNVVRTDIEDQWVRYNSDDPTSACYAQFLPSGSGSTAHVPSRSGNGGSIRPGWFVNYTTYDLLDNAIEHNQDATGSTPDRLITLLEYDANQNLIKLTKPEGNIVEYDYDERNLRIAERVGRDAAVSEDGALTITAYDANGNLLQIVGPAERGGAGNHTTITLGNAFGTFSNIVHTGDFVLENFYDGFDRVIESIDAVGNVTSMDGTLADPLLDPNGRVIGQIVQGPIGGATPTDRDGTNNVDLTRSFSRYDEAGRAYETQQDVFVADGTTLSSTRDVTHTGGGLETNTNDDDHTGTVTLVDNGVATANSSYVLTRSVYDRASRVVEMLADNVGLTENKYDGANRRIQSTDPAGNIVVFEHDAAGNVTLVTRTEKCTITEPLVADEVFLSATRYDSLNRPVVQAAQGADGTFDSELIACNSDALWQVASDTILTRLGYDSRGNRTLVIDPKGNTTVTIYDGANRATQTQQHLRQRGQGTEPPAANQTLLPYNKGSITTTSVLDGNSRLAQLIDDRGAPTTFRYDTLDRQTEMIFQDGSSRTRAYNPAGDVVEYTDENGSVFTNTFDAIGRKTEVAIALASGVIGTTGQLFEYDGLSRVTLGQDSVQVPPEPPSPPVGSPTIKTIKPGGGGDFESLEDWELWARTQASADQWAECYTGDVGGLELAFYNWTATPDGDHFPRVYSSPGESPTVGSAFAIIFNFAQCSGIRFLGGAGVCTFSLNVLIEKCRFEKIVSFYLQGFMGESMIARNCVFTDDVTLNNSFVSNANFLFLQNTVGGNVQTEYFSEPSLPTLTFTNVIANSFEGLPNSIGEGGITTMTYCMSADGTADDYGGTANIVDADFEDVFVDSASDDYHLKAGSDAIAAGTNLYIAGVTTDIDGYPRPDTGPFDLGAYLFEIPTVDADVNLYYDSLSRVLEDSQTYDSNTRNVTYNAFASYPPTGFTFPNDRQTTSVYDILYRRTLVEDTDGDIAAWEFFGPGRVAELTMGNGLIMSHMNNARTRSAIQAGLSTPAWGDDSSDRLGYDGAGRPITKRYLAGGIDGAYDDPTSVVGFTSAYDRSSNKFYERHLHAETRSHLYEPYSNGAPTGGYDSIDRLCQYQRGILSTTGGSSSSGGGSITTSISLPGTNEFRNYDLDGLGNWRRTSFEPVGDDEQLEIRQHNGLNQITRTDDVQFAYDGVPGASNGNLANDGVRSYEWDALNRLVKVYKTPDAPVLIGEYVYDALNRRIRKTVSNGGLSGTIPNGTTDFIYNPSWQCVEERNDDDPTKQYVWGIYIDELLQQKTFVTINGNVAGNYYPLSDLLYRTTALTDASGDIVEAYDCDAYGNTLIFTAAGTGDDWWADDATVGDEATCEYIFTGRRFDVETFLIYYRARIYAPVMGRFLQRDPIGILGGLNLYAYVSSTPLNSVDPLGLLGVGTRGAQLDYETGQIAFDPTIPLSAQGPETWPVDYYRQQYAALIPNLSGSQANLRQLLNASIEEFAYVVVSQNDKLLGPSDPHANAARFRRVLESARSAWALPIGAEHCNRWIEDCRNRIVKCGPYTYDNDLFIVEYVEFSIPQPSQWEEHAALRLTFAEGGELYMDNGALGSLFGRQDLPTDWYVTPIGTKPLVPAKGAPGFNLLNNTIENAKNLFWPF